jgi:hypothetical protein
MMMRAVSVVSCMRTMYRWLLATRESTVPFGIWLSSTVRIGRKQAWRLRKVVFS